MESQWIVALFVLLYGLLIGSFLNVCIYRIPIGKNIAKGRSYCPGCDALIPWYRNIPVFSYLFLKGRCANCGMRISLIYPVVELLNGLLYLLAFYLYGFNPESIFVCSLISVLIVVSFIDLSHQIIPNELVVFLLILGGMHAAYQVMMMGDRWYLYPIGFFAASLPLYLLGIIYPEGMGGGDIKLMAAAGLYLGPVPVLLALFFGALYAGVYSIYLVAAKKGSLKSEIPFGPYLSLGILTSALFGELVLHWYSSVFL